MHKDIREGIADFADLLLDAVFLVDANGCITYVSAACESIFGYTPEEMIGKCMIDLVAPADRDKTLQEARAIMAGSQRIGFENRYLRKDGSEVHVMWSARWLASQRMRIGVARDITELKRTQILQAATYAVSDAAHRASDLGALFPEIHQIIGKLVPVAGVAVATRDKHTEEIGFPYQMDTLGNGEVVQETLASQYCAKVVRSKQHLLVRGDFMSGLVDDVAPGTRGGVCLVMPLIPQQEAVGALILKSHAGTCFADKDIEMLYFVSAQIAAAIERAQLKAELLRAALYDDLTGLPNRKLFRDRINSALARCLRAKSRMALLYVDIDDFKRVNDSFGHAAGDGVLQEFARRLTQCVRQVDTVARLGGDEFAVLIEEIHCPEDALTVEAKIREALVPFFIIGEHALRTSASIGIAIYPDHGNDIERLIAVADQAMYLHKNSEK